MERLNDILGQAAQRRQQQPERRTQQGGVSKSQRFPQTPPPASRRGIYEQANRANQRPPVRPPMEEQNYVAGQPGATASREQRDLSLPAPQVSRDYGAGNVTRRHQSQAPMSNDVVPYGSLERYPQDSHYRRPAQPAPDDYYSDEYIPSLPADVVDDYDEFEDDEAGMRYGDWEQDGYDEVLIYQRPDVEMEQHPRSTYTPHDTQEDVDVTAYISPRPTRDLRERRTAPGSPSRAAVPMPQAHPQAMQRVQRVTQPLKPQALQQSGRDRQGQNQGQLPARQSVPTQRLPARQGMQAVATTGTSTPKNTCSRCKGAGYLRQDVPFGHPGFGKVVECDCKRAEKREKRRRQLRDMSNMDAFRKEVFASFNPRVPGVQEAYQVSLEYARNPQGWLLLIGPNGCGKTHLAAAIANQCLESESVVLFAVVPDLLDHLRAAFAPNAPEVYDQLFAKMREAEVLVLDDLGAQQSSLWANEKLFQLLNYRYNMGLPTVITANPRGLQGIDERISSRLTDVSIVTRVHLDRARDYRPHHPGRR